MRSWLDRLPAGHGRSAQFETGLRWSPGGATGAITHKLEQAGFKRLVKSRRFAVKDLTALSARESWSKPAVGDGTRRRDEGLTAETVRAARPERGRTALVGRMYPAHPRAETSQGGRQMTSTSTQARETISAFVDITRRAGGCARLGSTRLPRSSTAFQPTGRRAVSPKCSAWVDETLMPHMAWEESWLVREIHTPAQTTWIHAVRPVRPSTDRPSGEAIAGTPVPSRPRSLTRGQGELFEDLLGLETLLRADLEREEHFLIPLLESEADRWAP